MALAALTLGSILGKTAAAFCRLAPQPQLLENGSGELDGAYQPLLKFSWICRTAKKAVFYIQIINDSLSLDLCMVFYLQVFFKYSSSVFGKFPIIYIINIYIYIIYLYMVLSNLVLTHTHIYIYIIIYIP